MQPESLAGANAKRSVSIQESKAYFEKLHKSLNTRSSINQNDWQNVALVWSAADEVNLSDSSTVVIVPVADSAMLVNPYLDAYFVFYEDSISSISVNALIFQADSVAYPANSFPTIADFTGLIWEFDFKKDTIGLFKAENGLVTDCGCSNAFMEFAKDVSSGTIQIRTDPDECEYKGWLGEIFAGIGGFFADIGGFIGDVWDAITDFFSRPYVPNSSNRPSIKMGFVSSGTGAGAFGFGNGSSGHGSGSTSGSGSGSSINLSDYFSEWEIKQLQRAAIWMNNKYGTSLSVLALFGMMDIDCMWEISDFVEDPGGPSIDEENEGPNCATAFFLGSVLGLSDAETECISVNPQTLNALYELQVYGEVTDACDPNHTSEDILGDAISIACQNGGVNDMDDIYKAFDDNDKIVVSPSVPSGCPKYNCIFEEMMNGPLGTAFVCDVLSSFDEDVETPLIFRAIDFSVAPGYNPTAVASVEIIGGIINLSINTDFCNSANTRFAFETLQHELVHADIRRRLFEDFNWNGQNLTFLVAFDQLVTEQYGFDATPEEHAIMIQYYLDVMVASLIEMNGGIGVYEDFVGLVLTGFPPEVYSYIGLTTAEVLSLYNDYLNATTGQGNINHVLSNCN